MSENSVHKPVLGIDPKTKKNNIDMILNFLILSSRSSYFITTHIFYVFHSYS